jgi:hypothetical protein
LDSLADIQELEQMLGETFVAALLLFDPPDNSSKQPHDTLCTPCYSRTYDRNPQTLAAIARDLLSCVQALANDYSDLPPPKRHEPVRLYMDRRAFELIYHLWMHVEGSTSEVSKPGNCYANMDALRRAQL